MLGSIVPMAVCEVIAKRVVNTLTRCSAWVWPPSWTKESLDAEEEIYGQVYCNALEMELLKPITCERRMSGAPLRSGELVTARDMLPGHDPPHHTKETDNIHWQDVFVRLHSQARENGGQLLTPRVPSEFKPAFRARAVSFVVQHARKRFVVLSRRGEFQSKFQSEFQSKLP